MEKGAVIKHDIKKSPKTGDWRYMKPEVNKDKCTGCGTCVKYCPEAVIELENHKKGQKKKADIDYYFCKGCGVCSAVCPVRAIIMKKEAECIKCKMSNDTV
ncbi:4Fe-4S binding protein [Patescibacteria group bacterium]